MDSDSDAFDEGHSSGAREKRVEGRGGKKKGARGRKKGINKKKNGSGGGTKSHARTGSPARPEETIRGDVGGGVGEGDQAEGAGGAGAEAEGGQSEVGQARTSSGGSKSNFKVRHHSETCDMVLSNHPMWAILLLIKLVTKCDVDEHGDISTTVIPKGAPINARECSTGRTLHDERLDDQTIFGRAMQYYVASIEGEREVENDGIKDFLESGDGMNYLYPVNFLQYADEHEGRIVPDTLFGGGSTTFLKLGAFNASSLARLERCYGVEVQDGETISSGDRLKRLLKAVQIYKDIKCDDDVFDHLEMLLKEEEDCWKAISDVTDPSKSEGGMSGDDFLQKVRDGDLGAPMVWFIVAFQALLDGAVSPIDGQHGIYICMAQLCHLGDGYKNQQGEAEFVSTYTGESEKFHERLTEQRVRDFLFLAREDVCEPGGSSEVALRSMCQASSARSKEDKSLTQGYELGNNIRKIANSLNAIDEGAVTEDVGMLEVIVTRLSHDKTDATQQHALMRQLLYDRWTCIVRMCEDGLVLRPFHALSHDIDEEGRMFNEGIGWGVLDKTGKGLGDVMFKYLYEFDNVICHGPSVCEQVKELKKNSTMWLTMCWMEMLHGSMVVRSFKKLVTEMYHGLHWEKTEAANKNIVRNNMWDIETVESTIQFTVFLKRYMFRCYDRLVRKNSCSRRQLATNKMVKMIIRRICGAVVVDLLWQYGFHVKEADEKLSGLKHRVGEGRNKLPIYRLLEEYLARGAADADLVDVLEEINGYYIGFLTKGLLKANPNARGEKEGELRDYLKTKVHESKWLVKIMDDALGLDWEDDVSPPEYRTDESEEEAEMGGEVGGGGWRRWRWGWR